MTESLARAFLDKMEKEKYNDLNVVKHPGMGTYLKSHYSKNVATSYQAANNQRNRYLAQRG